MGNTDALKEQLAECAKKQDFEGAFRLVRENQAEFARLACRPKFGAGADGLIFIEDAEDADFRWRWFFMFCSQSRQIMIQYSPTR